MNILINLSIFNMSPSRPSPTRREGERGVVLIISLVFLMIMTIFGVTSMQGTVQEEKMSNNASQRSKAFQAAEAGLRVAENSFSAGNSSPSGLRSSPITVTGEEVQFWLDTYKPTWDSDSVVWGTLDTDHLNTPQNHFNYVIETLPTTNGNSALVETLEAGRPPPTTNQQPMYRITARGTGGISDAVVILQTVITIN